MVFCAQLGQLGLGGILGWLHGHRGGLGRLRARSARHGGSETAQRQHGALRCVLCGHEWAKGGRNRYCARADTFLASGREQPPMELRCPNASARTDEARSQAWLDGGVAAMACISPSCWPTWVPPPSAFYLVSLPEQIPAPVGPLREFSSLSAHVGRATWCGALCSSSLPVAGHRRC